VDLADLEDLHAHAREVADATHVHLDVGAVRFAGTALVGWLLHLRRDVLGRGGRVTLASLPRRLARLLHVAGAPGAFPVEEQAVAG
jgi:anti-anti-sigma regulatory factor